MVLVCAIHLLAHSLSPSTTEIAPWEHQVPFHWMGLQAQLKQHILQIPHFLPYFDVEVPESFLLSLDDPKTNDMATVAIREDAKLARRRIELVPRRMSQEQFWRVYFYVTSFIKQCKPSEVRSKLSALCSSGKLKQEQEELIIRLMEECAHLKEQSEELTEILERFNQLTMTEKMGRDLPPDTEKPSKSEIDDRMRGCIESKKKISLLASEVLDENYILQAQQVNVSFQVLMSQYIIFERLTFQPKRKLKSTSFTPKILGSKRDEDDASVTTEAQRKNIGLVLPIRFHRRHWRLLYSTREHGISLQTMYRHCANESPVLIIVQTTKGSIMGCFCGEAIHLSSKFYGSGETFVFRFKDYGTFNSYHWTKQNEYFVLSSSSGIAFGGGATGGAAIQLDAEFKYGSSKKCATFNSPPLVQGESEDHLADAGDFNIHAVECFAFDVGPTHVLSEKLAQLSSVESSTNDEGAL